MKIYPIEEIKQIVSLDSDLNILLQTIRQAFIDFSNGLVIVPLPLQMLFQNPPGDCHVKAGFNTNGNIFCIKVATGFYQNLDLGLPPGDGVILVFSKKTGMLEAILCDEGFLTILRTALAACVASKVTTFPVHQIGILGTGRLACLILQLIKQLYPDVSISLWGRNYEKLQQITSRHPDVTASKSRSSLLRESQLIITTTASSAPIVKKEDISSPLHIIALGADEPSKQELDPELFRSADKVIVDSKAQAIKFGDAAHAIRANIIDESKLQELGHILQSKDTDTSKLTITDLTGIAAQDIAISEYVLERAKG